MTNPSSKPSHPLRQIAESPTHKLLLKQWLKEEELILGRTAVKEIQLDTVRKEITQLYCFFFLFHSAILILLFSSSSNTGGVCHRLWIPSLCSLLCSLAIIWAIRYKTDVECHLEKLLEREKEDSQLLIKCVEELKKKGVEFDLLKEVDALRRAKSLRVETKPVYETRVTAEVQKLQLRYFGNQSLEMPTPISMPPIYHGMKEEEAVEAEDEYYHMWRFHYLIMLGEQRRICLCLLVEDKIEEADVEAGVRTKKYHCYPARD
ncbi:hypothetical protein GIB67_040005 [Kingdonia uniflora]|uniref:Uncharacterized protein n=1 Tax=Kingdonia uniflora TaxID=39325 RepID=A0A7J7LIC3_9MAGN|nr:hypothetical protein GIB67_040005 [Kingdonia uniflora]